MENFGFQRDEKDLVESQIEVINSTPGPLNIPTNFSNYRWRMRDFFYFHLAIFLFNSILCTGIVSIIEKDRQIPFVDLWFLSSTCVFTCGLQTVEFRHFSLPSQIVFLFYTSISGFERKTFFLVVSKTESNFSLFSGITVSTIPAILIKIYRLKPEESSTNQQENFFFPIEDFFRTFSQKEKIRADFRSLPDPNKLRRRSHQILIVLILSSCFVIYLSSFLAIGFWLKFKVQPSILNPHNETKIDPFYGALVITLTSFNQNGLSLW